ncbi:uncharacterized protein L969DRAFT_592399 [Mixia osmundae IAM 14324]|uniref:ABC transporter domain-containing protein n=1 Tax=Mixia osmundae (strain CBS 9802 / IAM 14324 / JCM 22182 / KY 12970) TaxID=764103 RepID=G7E4S9_MIXOS|nr:uncharacterized protein L969DRAFT_592399 [Mixia osmundae IAM 14324]KEI37659.1 hypothetical protein L969DRAFT_592399 [Mixia osmundae IAM 14324]GAA97839.1 hypothetical protein E5Q_04518 [Mixia osmundae IAM 14324]
MATNGSSEEDAVLLDNLVFAFSSDQTAVLRGIDLHLKQGSRCLLVGANGAGKSTLLQILAGKRLTKGKAKVLGQDPFRKTPAGVTYLGTEWANNPVVRSDLGVAHFLDSVGGYRHKERRDRLLDILDVDLKWHMHQISDGERRRVQIVSGLMAPWTLLLLDEVTVDLDVLVRTKLLAFLREECDTRGATVCYATHIFDGLDSFPTHVCHIQLGKTTTPAPLLWPFKGEPEGVPAGVLDRMNDPNRAGSRLLELALAWLAEDKEERKKLEEAGEEGFSKRGANSDPSDSESFYRKYDYGH